MEENERKDDEKKVNINDEDEIIVKERDTSLRKKKSTTPHVDYDFTANPMSPNKDGKKGFFFKILSTTSHIAVIGYIIIAILFFAFLGLAVRASFGQPLTYGKMKPQAIVQICNKYGEDFLAKDYSITSAYYKEYTAYPTTNKKLLFTVRNTKETTGREIVSDNYLSVAYAYFIDEYSGDLSGLSISLDTDAPTIILDTTFDKLDSELEKLYELKQFLISKSIAFEKLLFTVKLEHYYLNTSSGQYITSDTTLKEFIKTEKNLYILYLEENNFDLETEIPIRDLNNYRPNTLAINFSYKKIPESEALAYYDYTEHDYILNMNVVLDFIKDVKIINKENLHFYYKDTELKIEPQLTTREFEKTFDAYVSLNIKEKNMTIFFN